VAETGLGRCVALVDLPVGKLHEEAAALARRLLVEVQLLEPCVRIGDSKLLVAIWRHLMDPELVAVGPRHVLEVVIPDPRHGPGTGIVGEERRIGSRIPLGLITRVWTAELLVQVREETTDDRVALVGQRITGLLSRNAVLAPACQAPVQCGTVQATVESAAGRALRPLDLTVLRSVQLRRGLLGFHCRAHLLVRLQRWFGRDLGLRRSAAW